MYGEYGYPLSFHYFYTGEQLLQLLLCFSGGHILSKLGSTLTGKSLQILSLRIDPSCEWEDSEPIHILRLHHS